MRRRSFAVLVALLCAGTIGCKPKAAAGPRDLGSGTVSDDSGEVEVNFAYEPRPGGELQLLIRLNALGTEEMDKIAVDVVVDGLVVLEGSTQWSGFVPPRQPQSHSVLLKIADDAEDGLARISVTRFRDSKLLLHEEIAFELVAGELRAVSD